MLLYIGQCQCELPNEGVMAEWSKALVLGTSLRAWVRIPLTSRHFQQLIPGNHFLYTLFYIIIAVAV